MGARPHLPGGVPAHTKDLYPGWKGGVVGQFDPGIKDKLVIRLEAAALPPMEFHRWRLRDRFGKAVGLDRPIQTGDLEFDRTIYIETDASPEAARPFIKSPQLRRAITDAVQSFGPLCFIAQGLEVSILMTQAQDLKLINRLIAALVPIKNALPDVPACETVSAPATGDRLIPVMLLGAIAGATLLRGLTEFRVDRFAPIELGPGLSGRL